LKQKNKKAKAKATKNQKLTNSLTHVKSELVVSYSNMLCEQLKLVVKPTVLAAKHNTSFPSVCIAASAA
jgi:hypothetical protein